MNVDVLNELTESAQNFALVMKEKNWLSIDFNQTRKKEGPINRNEKRDIFFLSIIVTFDGVNLFLILLFTFFVRKLQL